MAIGNPILGMIEYMVSDYQQYMEYTGSGGLGMSWEGISLSPPAVIILQVLGCLLLLFLAKQRLKFERDPHRITPADEW